MRKRVMWGVLAAMLATAAATSQAWDTSRPATIRGATLSADSRTVAVQYERPGDCDGTPHITSSVTDERVVVSVTLVVDRRLRDLVEPRPCLPTLRVDATRIHLDAPLGGRPVVNEETGDEIPVEPARAR